jgi:hypothetical protein
MIDAKPDNLVDAGQVLLDNTIEACGSTISLI